MALEVGFAKVGNANFLKFPSEMIPGQTEVIETRAQWFSSTNAQSVSVNGHLHGDSADRDGGRSSKLNIFCF